MKDFSACSTLLGRLGKPGPYWDLPFIVLLSGPWLFSRVRDPYPCSCGIMFSDGFKVEIFKNRTAAANSLAQRCKVADDVDKSLWFDAWDRFTVDAYSQIPEYPTFPISYKNSKRKRKEYELEYKIECIKRFLPNLQKKHHFLSGASSYGYSVHSSQGGRLVSCLDCIADLL